MINFFMTGQRAVFLLFHDQYQQLPESIIQAIHRAAQCVICKRPFALATNKLSCACGKRRGDPILEHLTKQIGYKTDQLIGKFFVPMDKFDDIDMAIKAEKRKVYSKRAKQKRTTEDDSLRVLKMMNITEQLLAIQENSCYYCNQPFTDTMKPAHDHIKPVSKGGRSQRGNIILACAGCNKKKYNKSESMYWKILKKTLPPHAFTVLFNRALIIKEKVAMISRPSIKTIPRPAFLSTDSPGSQPNDG